MEAKKQIDLKKFEPVVKECLEFLAPHFRLRKFELQTFPFPTIKQSNDLKASFYILDTNEMLFNDGDENKPQVIGHEVGHFLHWHINQDACLTILNKKLRLLQEGVARYAELIYYNRGEIYKKPRIKLSDLALKRFADTENEIFVRELCLLVMDLSKVSGEKGLGNFFDYADYQKYFGPLS